MPTTPTHPTDEQTVYHAILDRLTAYDLHCRTHTEGSDTYGSYHFSDGSHITWGAHSNTGAENSTHPISAHRALNVYHDRSDENRNFETGDYPTDSAALIDWVITLADQHGRPSQSQAQ
ncbi:hypothetical protein ACH4UR_35830 [Streptomyces lydicus]|uniref:hypothetical protein n=1 Tax=Streptomyces lydicus TaxID=47763 RepID=UPI0034107F51